MDHGEPGLDLSCAEWIHGRELATVASDNWAVEAMPSPVAGSMLPLHCVLIRDLGMMLGEMFDLEQLADDCAADGQWDFFFSAPPLRVTGGVGSPAAPGGGRSSRACVPVPASGPRARRSRSRTTAGWRGGPFPDMVWAYVDSGAEDLTTLAANRSAFDRYRLRSRVLTGNEATDLGVSVLGADLSLPVLLAPTGVAGLSHWTGEVGAAQAAERAGTLSILSTAGSYTIEEVAAATEQDHVFQLYPWADPDTGRHDLTGSFLRRARTSGYRALVVTVDVPVHGNRESERTRGMGVPPVITPRRVLDAAAPAALVARLPPAPADLRPQPGAQGRRPRRGQRRWPPSTA